jgi:hypothetical protein
MRALVKATDHAASDGVIIPPGEADAVEIGRLYRLSRNSLVHSVEYASGS